MIAHENIVFDIPVAGIQKMTTIDFPGHLAAVIFVKGCPWNCRYCHNIDFNTYNPEDFISWDSIDSLLKIRSDYLDGIVISGGEPTFHQSLPELLKYIRKMGYKTAIHTNGFYPDMLQLIIKEGLVDYVALDIKGPPKAYDRITQCKDTCFPVSKSIGIVVSSGIEYEFRTTYHPAILSEEELLEVMKATFSTGVKRYYLQKFHKDGVYDKELVEEHEVINIPEQAINLGQKMFAEFGIR